MDEVENFSKTTQMTMQVTEDLEVVKMVVENIQDMLAEAEEKLDMKLNRLHKELHHTSDSISAKVDAEVVKVSKIVVDIAEVSRMAKQNNKDLK